MEASVTHNLREVGKAYREERWSACAHLAKKVVATAPQKTHAWRFAGAAAFHLGDLDDALIAFEKVIELGQLVGDISSDDWLNLASVLDQPQRSDLYERAEVAYRQALALNPDRREPVLRQLAALLRSQFRFNDARALLNPELENARAVGDHSAEAQLLNALGAIALEEGRWLAALPLVKAACVADSQYAEAQFSLALGLLATGDYAAGWPLHEWRWKVSQAKDKWRDYGQPWAGEPLGQRILLIWEEQGLGDVLQFSRFLPHMRSLYSEAGLIFVCRSSLHPVLANMAEREQISLLPAESAIPGRVQGHDVHVPLLSLPLHLGCTLSDLPPPTPLSISKSTQYLWQQRVSDIRHKNSSHQRQLGLVWSGSNIQTMAQRRNISLSKLEPLLSLPDVQWHSLQLGDASNEIQMTKWHNHLVDWSEHLNDFGDTAGLMMALDGVVSVDTSCVHLAASLNRPTWMLSRFDACWRWMAPQSTSPWYPSLNIFNQEFPSQWEAPVHSLLDTLRVT